MASLVIPGSGGFLGKAVIERFMGELPIKAVVRTKTANLISDSNISWHEADLLIPHSLDSLLEKDDIVVNTAYIPSNSKKDNLLLLDNILSSCLKKSVKRLIHCSTANVVGKVDNVEIDESVVCNPLTEYERVKCAIEEYLLANTGDALDIIIVRPSAIVGAGGKNLVKLAESLLHGNKLINYFRASLFKNRKMHLVSVHHVAAAIQHLSQLEDLSSGNIYFVASDDDAKNNFISVEKMLREALEMPSRKTPLLPIPVFLLSWLLKMKGRSESNSAQIYKSDKLLETGFVSVEPIQNAIEQFGKAFLKQSMVSR